MQKKIFEANSAYEVWGSTNQSFQSDCFKMLCLLLPSPMQRSMHQSFAAVDLGLQVVKKQLQPEEAPQRRLFKPAQLPAVPAACLQGLCVGTAAQTRVCIYPESVLAASAGALTLGCGLTSSYGGSSASFAHPALHPRSTSEGSGTAER